MLITQHDIDTMADDVRGIVSSWGVSLTIITRKPIELQASWDPIMKEFNGDIAYDTVTVPAERKDVAYVNTTIRRNDVSGPRFEDSIAYSISDLVEFDDSCTFTIDDKENGYVDPNAVYQIKSVKSRIGENILFLRKIDGGAE